MLGLQAGPDHLNPHQVVHRAILDAMADTGMGAALYPKLAPGEICATIEIKINDVKPVREGRLACETEIVHRGKSVANLQSRVLLGDTQVAMGNGHHAIFKPRSAAD